ncbi:tripartite tricarboxylate transporter TctB family protein [Halalkalibacter oceani]|uniref:tripartite tricarboxylate transporter TctB family protein n=1 Tax=Halalkalibacter oceani TaxID=1653776 RepID=UPI003396E5F3
MKKGIHQDVYIGAGIIIFSLFVFIKSYEFMEEVGFFPRVLSIIFAGLALILILKGLKSGKGISDEEKGEEESVSLELLKSPIAVFFIILIYIGLISFVGFFVSTSLFLIVLMMYLKEKKIVTYAVMVLGLNVFIYFLFVYQLGVRLPRGLLF